MSLRRYRTDSPPVSWTTATHVYLKFRRNFRSKDALCYAERVKNTNKKRKHYTVGPLIENIGGFW